MSSEAVRDALVGLGWSLFTEMGVPGVVRHHGGVVLDPEPLVVVAPLLFPFDARLRDQVAGWCAVHADRLSVSRLQGLARQLPEPANAAFYGLSATLRRHAKVRWPDAGADPWGRMPEVHMRPLPVERPALLRFRLRAVSGVGARADVLGELLWRTDRWTRASDLASLGYSKRAVAGILSELGEAGLALQRPVGNALTYQLAHAEVLATLVGGRDVAFADWWSITALMRALLALVDLEHANLATRRIEAHRLGAVLSAGALELSLEPPPATRGQADAWERLVDWGTRVAQALEAGTSPALGGQGVARS